MYENASNKWSNYSIWRSNRGRNIEKEYTLGQKNVHAIIEEEEKEETENAKPQTKAQACEETKRVPLDPLVPDK